MLAVELRAGDKHATVAFERFKKPRIEIIERGGVAAIPAQIAKAYDREWAAGDKFEIV